MNYIITISIFILIALLSKSYTGLGAEYVTGYVADVMAVAIVYLVLKLITKISEDRLVIYVVIFALLIELSQLIQHSLLQTIRTTTVGQIIIGGTFDWLDIIAYLFGTILTWYTLKYIETVKSN